MRPLRARSSSSSSAERIRGPRAAAPGNPAPILAFYLGLAARPPAGCARDPGEQDGQRMRDLDRDPKDASQRCAALRLPERSVATRWVGSLGPGPVDPAAELRPRTTWARCRVST